MPSSFVIVRNASDRKWPAAVLEEVESEIAVRMLNAVEGVDPASTVALLLAGAGAVLDACAEPDLQRIVLLDGPSVLGWDGWREICLRHSVGLVSALLSDGIARGTIPEQPVDPLTHILVGSRQQSRFHEQH